MICNQCRNEINDGAEFCPYCGAQQNGPAMNSDDEQTVGVYESQGVQPMYQQYDQSYTNEAYEYASEPVHNGSVGFVDAIKLFFKNYANFTGRASLSEYWWAELFMVIVMLVPCFWILLPFIIVPGWAVTVRRLHDIGKSWVYILMSYIPFVGSILLIIECCKESEGDNQWGPGPKRVI